MRVKRDLGCHIKHDYSSHEDHVAAAQLSFGTRMNELFHAQVQERKGYHVRGGDRVISSSCKLTSTGPRASSCQS